MPRISGHGNPGHSLAASSFSRMAAALITSSLRSTAAIVFMSCRNASKSIPSVNCWMLSMASAMSRRALTASSKGKHGLALGAPANRFLESVGGGQINLHAEQVLQAVFQLDHVDEREPAPRLKLRDQ